MPHTAPSSKNTKELQVAVLGGGGRESAFVKLLLNDTDVSMVHFIKPNAGFQNNPRVKNVEIDVHDQPKVVSYCQENNIQLAICGSEELAAIGLNDALKKGGIQVFGASLAAIRIEADKAWARKLMSTLGIPQPQYEIFSDPEEAKKAAAKNEKYRIVKAFGLASGKGVYVCDNQTETEQAIQEIMVEKKFGKSGDTVVIEERLGWNDPAAEEVSMMFYTDGKTLAALPLARDHKREFDHDKGKNTGGMGAYSPSPLLNAKEQRFVQKEIAQKIIDQWAKQGSPFTGILYVGLMKTSDTSRNPHGIFVIEINGRGGDPETLVQLDGQTNEHPSQIFLACTNGTLAQFKPTFDDLVHIDVVLCSTAYPEGKTSGEAITGIEEAESMGVKVLHAGTTIKDGKVVTNGGRILGVVAKGKTLEEARQKAYPAAQHILFDGKKPKYRQDIGAHGT
jgi:phosphoribosylamine---glycine ligase